MRLIGLDYIRTEELKPEYRTHDILTGVEIRIDKKRKKLDIKILPYRTSFDRIFWPKAPKVKKARKRIAKRLSKITDDDKPVDTSKWVRPDKESIQHELLKRAVLLLVLKEDTITYAVNKGKFKLCYGIIHSDSPHNPQGITSFAHMNYIEPIYGELGNKRHSGGIWKICSGLRKSNMGKLRKEVAQWKKDRLKEMIRVNKGSKRELAKRRKEMFDSVTKAIRKKPHIKKLLQEIKKH